MIFNVSGWIVLHTNGPLQENKEHVGNTEENNISETAVRLEGSLFHRLRVGMIEQRSSEVWLFAN